MGGPILGLLIALSRGKIGFEGQIRSVPVIGPPHLLRYREYARHFCRFWLSLRMRVLARVKKSHPPLLSPLRVGYEVKKRVGKE